METSLNISSDLIMSDFSSDSSSSCLSYSPSPSRSSLESFLSSSSSFSSSSSLAVLLKDDDDDGKENDFDDVSKAGNKFPAPLSYSFKISEAEREIFKDLEKERIDERKDDVEIVVKRTKKMKFLNIKKKKRRRSLSCGKKMKWGENSDGRFSPASRTNDRRRRRRETTFRDYIDLSRVSVLNENDEIILNSKNRNIISDDIYEPDQSLPDLKINDVCYMGAPPHSLNGSCCSSSNNNGFICAESSASLIPNTTTITDDVFSNVNVASSSYYSVSNASSTANTHDTFRNI